MFVFLANNLDDPDGHLGLGTSVVGDLSLC